MKAPGGGDMGEYKELIAVTGAVGLGEAASVSLRLGELLYGAPEQDGITWQPLDLVIRMMTGEVEWTGAATAGAVTLVAGTVAGAAGSVWAWRVACAKCRELKTRMNKPKAKRVKPSNTLARTRIPREAIDSQARWMARGRELDDLGPEAMAEQARKLKVQLRDGDAPGVMIARAVADGRPLYGSYEDLHLDIWGPRSGKSTSRVIPAVMEAPGAVVATSNKRDVVDATRAVREQSGEVAWVFDPQSVAAEPCTWYWDPIAWVAGEDGGAGAQERAAELAGHFASAGEADKRDAFFDPEGEGLLASLFLACAMVKRPITQAFDWLTTKSNREPIEILEAAGFGLMAGALHDQYTAPDKQKGGVFSTARKMAACLMYTRIHPWVCPPAKGRARGARSRWPISCAAAAPSTRCPRRARAARARW
ncbi:type IV secretory system conjugative DNA transfer family protein [Nocardia sp. IFM 10818]